MDIVARLSGDEFIVLVQQAVQIDDVLLVVEKILNAMQQPYHLAGREVFSTCSIGVSVYPNDGEQPNDLLKHADAAMYRAKEEGRNRYRLFDASMHEMAARRLETETELRYAIERDELELYYQPQLNHRGWPHYGLRSPDPLAASDARHFGADSLSQPA
jgi:predicted signal transduction protein with EAL and GGDEF domain